MLQYTMEIDVSYPSGEMIGIGVLALEERRCNITLPPTPL